MEKNFKILAALFIFTLITSYARAADDELKAVQSANEVSTVQSIPVAPAASVAIESQKPIVLDSRFFDPVNYTLGPEDMVEITVMRHPEFSGVYPINLEGKLQYKFVGDIDVNGLTKKQLEDKIKEIISAYVISPEVNVTVTEYKSKVIYVLGEVASPGKYYMKSESVSVREAVMMAGLPLQSAAMRKCRLITPDKSGNAKTKDVDMYSILYNGDLKKNIDMHPGDVFYVPSTVMAKVIRMINPVASTIGIAASAPDGISSGKSAVTTMAK